MPRNRSRTRSKSKRSLQRDWSGVAEADRTDNDVDPIIFLYLYFLAPWRSGREVLNRRFLEFLDCFE
jgi:hypothetical protein